VCAGRGGTKDAINVRLGFELILPFRLLRLEEDERLALSDKSVRARKALARGVEAEGLRVAGWFERREAPPLKLT
jgi:hypothetical protein